MVERLTPAGPDESDASDECPDDPTVLQHRKHASAFCLTQREQSITDQLLVVANLIPSVIPVRGIQVETVT
jgi:hypothetical protein